LASVYYIASYHIICDIISCLDTNLINRYLVVEEYIRNKGRRL